MTRVGGKNAASLRAISEFNDRGVRGRKRPAGEKASPSDHKDFKPILKVQYNTQHSASKGAPRCEAPVRAAIGKSLWNRFWILYSAQDPPSVLKKVVTMIQLTKYENLPTSGVSILGSV